MVQELATKSAAAEALKSNLLLLERQAGRKLKAVRSDRGGEYVNESLKKFFAERGVQHQLSAAYTPQQNGSAERLNRTLVERALAMLLESGLPLHLWAEAIATANYVRNRSPVASSAGMTPLEMFYGKKPDVKHLRVFGATAYALKHGRRKLDAKSSKGVMVGYDGAAYRIWKPDSGKVDVRREEIFDEQSRYEKSAKLAGGLMEPDQSPDDGVDDDGDVDDAGDAAPPGEHADGGPLEQSGDEMDVDGGGDEPRYPKRNREPPVAWWQSKASRNAGTANMAIVEPATLQEARASDNANEWEIALNKEYASLEANQTWELVRKPPGVKPLPCKLVFKVKRDALGNIERFKVRLVAKGFAQRPGVDFDEVYAPVSKHTTLRVLLAKVAVEGLVLRQLDVTTAFLNGDLDEEIYMEPPEGLPVQDGEDMCFRVSNADPGFFIYERDGMTVWILVYVDDILVAAKTAGDVDFFVRTFLC
jgi:Reverse transcriptase (RNA-dependent DNA polymerase)